MHEVKITQLFTIILTIKINYAFFKLFLKKVLTLVSGRGILTKLSARQRRLITSQVQLKVV